MTTDFDGHKITLEFASGWTDYIPGESFQTLMMRVDTALYANKRVAKAKREDKAANEAFEPGPSSAGQHSSASPSDNSSTLTPRERQVLQLLGQGKSNKQVAAELGLSVRTVETYRAKIMAHLKVHSVGELVFYAVSNKIVKIDGSG